MKKKYKVTNGKLKVVRREIIAKAAEVNMTLTVALSNIWSAFIVLIVIYV